MADIIEEYTTINGAGVTMSASANARYAAELEQWREQQKGLRETIARFWEQIGRENSQ